MVCRFINKSFLVIILIFSSNISFSQVSLEDKIGQMIMVGFSGIEVPDSLKYDLQYRNLGGVVLFASNVKNPQQLLTLTTQLKKISKTFLFIGIDQEGGKVARLSQTNGYEATNSAYRLGSIINFEDSTRYTASKMAEWLYTGGININLAPVVDVNVNLLNPVIGMKERSFSDDPFVVTKHAKWFRSEFNKKGIFTTLKHFPGHGSSKTDSHLGFTDISDTWTVNELIPYKELIQTNSLDFVMVGHLYNRSLDSIYPASLSEKVITGLLRDSLKFNGIVISDELFMKAITDNYTFDYAIELCIKAGTDILLFSTNLYNKRSITGYLIETISEKVKKGIIPEQLINNSYDRIMRYKNRLLTNIKYYTKINTHNDIIISNYPNPFNSESKIKFSLPESGKIKIIIFDALGKEIITLIDSQFDKGEYIINFDANKLNLCSGVYFYTLFTKNNIITKKMLLLK